MFPSFSQLAALLATQEQPAAQGCDGGLMAFAPYLLMFAIFWVLVFLPMRRERKQHQDLLAALKRGDEVLTQSGLLGTITDIADPLVTLEIAKNVKIRVLRSSISKKYVEPKGETKGEAKKEEAKA
ncbi:MAG: preprotein translocase subunit YajC [Deltaproteobacteria bacterium]|nr:preprotein translocase subunit YajC [Deltaproteobacteria bacterium]